MLSDTLTGMDEGINLDSCRYGLWVHNNDLHVKGSKLISSTGHMKYTFVLLCGLK